MNPVILLTDSNTLSQLVMNNIDSFAGGDWIFIGIIVFVALAAILLYSKVRSGGVVVVGISVAYLLSLFNPVFQFIFWLGIIAGIFMLIMGLRRQTTQ